MNTRLKIETVKTGGTAEAIGLCVGDILEVFNGIATCTDYDLDRAIKENSAAAQLSLLRNYERMLFTVPAGPLGITVTLTPYDQAEIEKKQNLNLRMAQMIVTTTPSLEGFKVVKTIDIVSAECVFGLNIFKDFFMNVSDFFGGRSGTAQDALRTARIKCLDEMKKEAARIGANAVIGVDLDYSEFSGKGNGMLFLVATGTAVLVEKENC